MATLRTPNNLAHVSVASIPGVTQEDVEELRVLGIMSIQSLMAAMDTTNGELQDLSNDHAVIEPLQAKRIGDCLIAFDQVPEGWRNRWVFTTTSVTLAPVPAPASPPATRPGWFSRFWNWQPS